MLDQKLTSPTKWPKPWVLFLSVVSAQILAVTLFTPSVIQAQSSTEVPSTFSLPASLPADAKVNLDGSSSMSTINQSLVQRFEQKFPGAKVSADVKGTDTALTALDKGELDIAAIGRPLTAEEKAKGLVSVPISREKIAIVVSEENPFNGNVTFEQFAKIFRGEITDWSQLEGGTAGPIRFVDRPVTSDTRQAFQNYPVFQQAPFETGATATALSEDSTDAMVAELGKDGIGYAIASQALNRPGVRVISMHQTLPDDPRYPFSQPRDYVYKGSPNPAVQAFLAFATTPEGKEAVSTATTTEAVNPTGGGSPDATASSNVALVPETGTASTEGGGAPWWPWLILPLAAGGGLLWALSRGKKGAADPADPVTPFAEMDSPTMIGDRPKVPGAVPLAAGAAAAGAAAVGAAAIGRSRAKSRIVLTPRNHESAYAYWEVPETEKADARRQGGQQMGLRLHDVTGIADIDRQTPHRTQRFECHETDQDKHLPIPQDNRDYQAEVGYTTREGQWLSLARSQPVRVPARPPLDTVARAAGTGLAGGVAAAGAGVAAVAGLGAMAGRAMGGERTQLQDDRTRVQDDTTRVQGDAPTEGGLSSRIVLSPRNADHAYAYWEVPEKDKAALRRAGGNKPALRIYDVTDIPDMDRQTPHGVQQYDWDELSRDRHVSVPNSNRDYVAELGYETPDGRWLRLARSLSVRVPIAEGPGGSGFVDQVKGVGGDAIAQAKTTGGNIFSQIKDAGSDAIAQVKGGGGDAVSSGGDVMQSGVSGFTAGAAGLAAGAAGLAAGAAGLAAGAGAKIRSTVEHAQDALSGDEPLAEGDCQITHLTVNAKQNCYQLDANTVQKIQQTAASQVLEPGTYLVKIDSGTFRQRAGFGQTGEPVVLLWVYGGKVVNQKTNAEVNATWSSLNGYDDLLSLNVLERATLSAFFFDTEVNDNGGEINLSIVKV